MRRGWTGDEVKILYKGSSPHPNFISLKTLYRTRLLLALLKFEGR